MSKKKPVVDEPAFSWFYPPNPKSRDYQLNKKKPEQLTLYGWLVRPVDSEKYLQFPNLFNDAVINLTEFLERADAKHKDKGHLQNDLDKGAITCKLYHRKTGNELQVKDYEKTPLYQRLVNHNSKDAFKSYLLLWQSYFREAMRLTRHYRPQAGAYDVLSRFYIPPMDPPPINLRFIRKPRLNAKRFPLEVLQDALKVISPKFGVVGEWRESEDEAMFEYWDQIRAVQNSNQYVFNTIL